MVEGRVGSDIVAMAWVDFIDLGHSSFRRRIFCGVL